MRSYLLPEFLLERDEDRCTRCGACIKQCSFEVHRLDEESGRIVARPEECVGCQRCVVFCPAGALRVVPAPPFYRPNYSWTGERIRDIKRQAETGGVLLRGCGDDSSHRIYWDHLLLNASQVTNPSIDPLREPMELKTFLGRRPDRSYSNEDELGAFVPEMETEIPPNLMIEIPFLFSAMSYGAISYPAFKSLAMAASELGTFFNTGEGGLPRDLRRDYGSCAIVQIASGRFGVDAEYLNSGMAVEIKVGQGAKPGIGGHLPGEKVSSSIAATRMIPEGTDALSPAPHHDIYSIEDLSTLIYAVREATNYEKPVIVKIAAVHNSAAIASGIVRAGADVIALDGIRGGTGAAPKMVRENVGIPIELALAAVDDRLRKEGIRNRCSVIASGGIRCSGDVIKAIALGADAVYIGTAALVAMGCTLCQMCYSGKCAWGICTQDPYLTKRLDPQKSSRRLVNLLQAWSMELKEMLGGMGINAIDSLRGNRDQLRGIGLQEWELDVLGIKGAGE